MSGSDKQTHLVYFRIIVALFPLLLVLVLELSLRAFDYGGNLALFVPLTSDAADKQYLRINPQVAQRYFPKGGFVPLPTSDGFLKEKPANSYRIFALGESTTAGWPYPNNVMFTRLLKRRLDETFPDKHIEVVNLGVAAINSFTLLDFIDEVLQQKPDAILIYTGHNEYYGALGAASTISLGDSVALVRLYLALQRFKTFVLLRNAINRVTQLAQRGGGAERADKFPTLMGQVIGKDHIPLGSDIYQRGKTQFQKNMDTILAKIGKAGVPVVLSELVSNLRDQPPFFSDRSEATAAMQAFQNARKLETSGRIDAARAEYTRAKDWDGLRFRAPEEFNTIIHALAKEHGVPVVPMKAYFEAASPQRLIGNSLMLEHLHPNARGHQLMSQAFFETMRAHGLVTKNWDVKQKAAGAFAGFSDLDVAIGKIRILHLTDHWPFKTKPTRAVERYVPRTQAEEIAKAYFLEKINFSEAHMKMAEYYGRAGAEVLALQECWALVNSAPLHVDNSLLVAKLLIRARLLQQAFPFLDAAAQIGINRPGTAEVLATLTEAYLQTNQVAAARQAFARLQEIQPKHPGIEKLAGKLR